MGPSIEHFDDLARSLPPNEFRRRRLVVHESLLNVRQHRSKSGFVETVERFDEFRWQSHGSPSIVSRVHAIFGLRPIAPGATDQLVHSRR
jgi:hypothetical protein